jgi:hypothetical protein
MSFQEAIHVLISVFRWGLWHAGVQYKGVLCAIDRAICRRYQWSSSLCLVHLHLLSTHVRPIKAQQLSRPIIAIKLAIQWP